jgi:hypothetical protein
VNHIIGSQIAIPHARDFQISTDRLVPALSFVYYCGYVVAVDIPMVSNLGNSKLYECFRVPVNAIDFDIWRGPALSSQP